MAEVRRGPAHVLFVCTGNVCRSPLAERLMLGGLQHRRVRGVAATSAGTHALVGSDMTPPTAALVEELGGAALPHGARQVTREMVLDADLVVVLTRQHRSEVVTMAPAVLRRAFTLREIERLLAGIDDDKLATLPVAPADRVRALSPLLLANRGPVPDPLADDVVDPYGGSRARYRRSADEIAPAVAALVDVIAGGDPEAYPAEPDPEPEPEPDDEPDDEPEPEPDDEPDDEPDEVEPDDAAGPVTPDAAPQEPAPEERRGSERRSWVRQGWERRRGGRDRRT